MVQTTQDKLVLKYYYESNSSQNYLYFKTSNQIRIVYIFFKLKLEYQYFIQFNSIRFVYTRCCKFHRFVVIPLAFISGFLKEDICLEGKEYFAHSYNVVEESRSIFS